MYIYAQHHVETKVPLQLNRNDGDIWTNLVKPDQYSPWIDQTTCKTYTFNEIRINESEMFPQCLIVNMTLDLKNVNLYSIDCEEKHYFACEKSDGKN